MAQKHFSGIFTYACVKCKAMSEMVQREAYPYVHVKLTSGEQIVKNIEGNEAQA